MGNGVLTAGRKKPIDKTRPRGNKTHVKTAVKTAAQRDTLKFLRAHVDKIEKRLSKAQSLSRVSVKTLSTSFEKLNQATQMGANAKTTRLAEHIDVLSAQLSQMIEQTRTDVAHDLQIVMADPRLETLSSAVTKANQRLTRSETLQAQIIDNINGQIAKLAAGLETEIQARQAANRDLNKRIDDIETQSTVAIKTIGDKVVEATENLKQKAELARQEIGEKGLGLEKNFEEHKADMAMRIEAMEDDQRNTIPTIERRLVTMATRLEVLEAAEPAPQIRHEVDNFGEGDTPRYEAPPHIEEDIPQPSRAVQTDAFSPSEAVAMQEVTPPQNPYTLQDTQSLETAQTGTFGIVAAQAPPERFVPQEFVPQEYQQVAPTPSSDVRRLANVGDVQSASVPAYAPEAEPAQYQQAVYQQIEPVAVQPIAPAMAPEISPPPFADALIQDPALQSMGDARPGAEPKTGKLSLLGKLTQKKTNQKAPKRDGGSVSTPVKTTALMVGVAVVGLFAAKTVLPKFIGGDTPAPVKTDLAQTQNQPQPVGQQSTQQAATIQTVDAIGDYSNTMQAPNLGQAVDGGPSAQKLTLEAAAAKGEAVAQFQLGLSHLEAGRNGQAVRLIRLAANQNQAAAQYRLGKLYEAGVGVQANPRTAVEYLEQAANGGNRIAMHDLGHYYATGVIGPADIGRAVRWFEKAAKRGVLDSQFNLGVLYQGGSGVPKDIVQSYIWYAVAGGQGDKVASQRAQMVAKDLDKAQLSQAQAQIKAFTPTQINDAANGVFKNLPWVLSAKKTIRTTVPENGSVQKAQGLLLSLGYDVGTPDGAMGPRTRNAVIRFERANNLPETGRVNAALLDRLSLAVGV